MNKSFDDFGVDYSSKKAKFTAEEENLSFDGNSSEVDFLLNLKSIINSK